MRLITLIVVTVLLAALAIIYVEATPKLDGSPAIDYTPPTAEEVKVRGLKGYPRPTGGDAQLFVGGNHFVSDGRGWERVR